MGLAEIAEGMEFTTQQQDRDVHPIDDTTTDLSARLQDHREALPCSPDTATAVIEEYTREMAVAPAAEAADISSMTAIKLLYRCGVTGLSPLSESDQQVLTEWLCGVRPRSDILNHAGIDEQDLALATYLETHQVIPELKAALRGHLEPRKRDITEQNPSESPMTHLTDSNFR